VGPSVLNWKNYDENKAKIESITPKSISIDSTDE
jgi:hypothetical protein